MTESASAAAAFAHCARIAAEHGRTYHLATRLLAPPDRRAVHALYAFARSVDDIVDHPHEDAPGELDRLERRLWERLDRPGPELGDDPVLFAVTATILRYHIPHQHFRDFLDAMRMDLPGSPLFRTRYADLSELRVYMHGSAAAIGLQLLPILGTVAPVAAAEPAAAALGEAFQLTNFLRDVAEDLDRGRVYLPADHLAAFGVDEALLTHCRHTGRTDPRMRRALADLIAVNRAGYRTADAGIELLRPKVRPAIRTASRLYAGILDEIEGSGYAIFRRRATVPTRRRLRVAAIEFARHYGGRQRRDGAIG